MYFPNDVVMRINLVKCKALNTYYVLRVQEMVAMIFNQVIDNLAPFKTIYFKSNPGFDDTVGFVHDRSLPPEPLTSLAGLPVLTRRAL